MNTVIIGGSPIGEGHPCVIVAEGGINHQGNIEVAKCMIDAAIDSGCNAIKWQKRTVEIVYSQEELARPRDNPFGPTNGDLKRGLEFNRNEYTAIDIYCKTNNFAWFASCWDEQSVDFISQYDPPCFKIASPCLTDDNLLRYHRQFGKPIILSTGMSSERQVDHAVDILGTSDLVILHCVSTYPAKPENLNLKVIQTFKDKYKIPIGFSGHEVGLSTTIAAATLGANMIERHICLDRSDWGSDMSASVEPQGMKRLVRDIRVIETAIGDGIKDVLADELPLIDKLRRVDTTKI